MWILDKYGAAINLEKITKIYCNNKSKPFFVKGATGHEYLLLVHGQDPNFGDMVLADFETRAEAKAYIADLVTKLNLEKNHGQIAHNAANKAV